jgi:hypothetical protein
MKAIVTVKLARNPHHNPMDKQAGRCPLSDKLGYFLFCSDVTGEHHSYIEEGFDLAEIWTKAKLKFGHITRIEAADKYETQ